MDLRGNSYPTRIELCGNALHHADTLKNGFVSFLGVEPNSLLYPCCKHGEKRMIRCRAHMLPDKNGGLLPAHQITDILGTPVVRPAPLRNLKIGGSFWYRSRFLPSSAAREHLLHQTP